MIADESSWNNRVLLMTLLCKWHERGRYKMPGTPRFQAESSRYERPKVEINSVLHIKNNNNNKSLIS